MAGFEVKDRNHVASLRDDQREDICTKRRRAIVEWAADSKLNGCFSVLCEMCGRSVDFEDKNSVQRAGSCSATSCRSIGTIAGALVQESVRSTPHPALYPQLITTFACAQWECLCRRSWTMTAARSATNGT